MYHYMQGEFEKAHACYGRAVQLWEAHPHRIAEESDYYKSALGNYLNSSHQIRKYDAYLDTIAKIKKIPAKNLRIEAEEFQNIIYLQQVYYLDNENMEAACDLIPELEAGLQKYRGHIARTRLITLYINTLLALFLSGRYEAALDWVSRLLDVKTDLREDIQNFVRLLEIIIHYEVSNMMTVEYVFGINYRYLYKRQRINEFEKIVFKYLRKLTREYNKKTISQRLRELKAELETLHRQSKRPPVGLEALIFWLNRKLNTPVRVA